MKLKSLLLALAAMLVILPGCSKKEEVKDPSKQEDKPATNEFITRLNSTEALMGKSAADAVAELQKEGLKSAEAGEDGKINASDTVSGIVYTFYATCGTSGNVNYITLDMTAVDTKAYVADASKMIDAVTAIGENHNLPSGNALAFNDYSFTKSGEETQTGYDWKEMTTGLPDLASTTSAIFNWKNSGSTYGRMCIVRTVTDEGTTVRYLLQDYSYND